MRGPSGLCLGSGAHPALWAERAGGGGAEPSDVCSSFKLFLELEPQVRDIIFKFYESKYASCLKMLDEMKVRGAVLALLAGFLPIRVPNQLPSAGQPALGHVPGAPCQNSVHPDPQPCAHPGRRGQGW